MSFKVDWVGENPFGGIPAKDRLTLREALRRLAYALRRDGAEDAARRVLLVSEEPLDDPRAIEQLAAALGPMRMAELREECGR